jgi:hypothetical protein
MKFAILLAAAVSLAAPTSSAAVILAEVTNPVNGAIVTGGGNYIEPGFTGEYTAGTSFFTLTVVFQQGVFKRFDSLLFDYQTFGGVDFEVILSSRIPFILFPVSSTIIEFQEPAATAGYKRMEVDLKNLWIGQMDVGGSSLSLSFSVRGHGGSFNADNIVLTTQGNAVSVIPEPGSMISLACLLGAGAFVRRRALRA